MLNKSTGTLFRPMIQQSNAIEENFSTVQPEVMPQMSVELPTSTKTNRTVLLDEHVAKYAEIEQIIKVYVESTLFQYGIIAAAVLVSILINIIIIMLLT